VQNALLEVNFEKCIKLLRTRWYTYSEMLNNEEVLKQIVTARIGGMKIKKNTTGKMD
jgi:hypothetical protein